MHATCYIERKKVEESLKSEMQYDL